MAELSLSNIEQISRDIGKEEITFSHLLDDLIDHVCCDVENEMRGGADFQEAYKRVQSRMGSRRMKEIQEETLYCVDTKYRNMKKTMKISGIAATLLLGFASIFKIMHWPFAGIMLALGALLLAFVFMPSALGVLWKETKNNKRIFLYFSAFVAVLFYILGMLFKVQHWPGANIAMTLAVFFAGFLFLPSLLANKIKNRGNNEKIGIYVLGSIAIVVYMASFLFKLMHWPLASLLALVGLFLLAVVVMPWYTFQKWKNDEEIDARFIYITVALLLFVVPATLVSLNLQKSYEQEFFYHQQSQKALFEYGYGDTRQLGGVSNDTATISIVSQLNNRTDNLIKLIESIEKGMIEVSEGYTGVPVENPPQIKYMGDIMEIDYNRLSFPFMKFVAEDFLAIGAVKRQELDQSLAAYKQFIASEIDGATSERFDKLLDTPTYIADVNPENGGLPLITALHSLELMKNGIIAVESQIIGVILSNN